MRSEKDYGKMNYAKLWLFMERKKVNKQWLLNNGFTKNALYKLVNNETVTTETICKLCYLLNCKPQQILEYMPPMEEHKTE